MSKTIYVVSERSFEYNDEIYHLPHDGSGDKSGQPKFAFSNKKAALLARDEYNVKWLKQVLEDEVGFSYYAYDVNDVIVNDRVFTNELNLKIDENKYGYESILVPEDFSEENWLKLVNCIEICPWIVSEVELAK